MSLCDSVTLWTINGLITLQPFIHLGRFFCAHLGKKLCLKKKISAEGWFGQGQGPKNSDLSSYLSYFTRYKSEKWNLGLKLQKKLHIKKKFGRWAKTDYANFGAKHFLHKNDPHLFWILISKLSKKIDWPIFGRLQPCI